MSEENEEEMTFEDAVLKELSLVKDLILKEDYLTDVVAKAVGTPLTADDISKAVGGSALVTEQQETATLVKSILKQLTSMQKTQTGLVKSIAALQKQGPEEEEELPVEEEEEKQVPEVPDKEELPDVKEPLVEEEEKQVPEIPEEEEKLPEEEKKQLPKTPDEEEELPDEEDFSKMITKDTSWEEVHTIAKKVRAY